MALLDEPVRAQELVTIVINVVVLLLLVRLTCSSGSLLDSTVLASQNQAKSHERVHRQCHSHKSFNIVFVYITLSYT
jgi:hypothetical protein